MEWDDLKVFLAVHRLGSLSAAARVLDQTQPTLGRRIKTLEIAVKQKLFHRTAEGFVLTHEGLSVVTHAERIEEEVLAFERAIAGKEQKTEGRIRVASLDWFGLQVLSPLFAKYHLKHPEVEVELITDSKPVSLSRREADIAFRVIPFDEANVIQKKIMYLPYSLYGHKSLPRPKRGSEQKVKIITMNTEYDDVEDARWLRNFFPHAKVSFRSNSREAQVRMCSSGWGYAVLPQILAESQPNLIRHDFRDAPPGRNIWMGYHQDLSKLKRIRELVDLTAHWG